MKPLTTLIQLCRPFTRHIGRTFIAATAAAALLVGTAHAQFGRTNDRAEFSIRDLPRLTEILNLDSGQKDLIEIFLTEYQQAYATTSEEFEEKQQALREELRDSGADRRGNWQEMIEPIRELQQERRAASGKLRDAFVTNVKSVLSEEQVDHWPAFEREMRRRQQLPQALIAGESVNLFDVVEEARVTEPERLKLKPILNEYDIALDDALVRREKDLEDIEEAFREIMREGNFDEALDRAEAQRKLRTRIRDINEQYAAMIAAELSDASEFNTIFNERAYPEVYNDTYAENVFKTAMTLELNPDALEAVSTLADSYFTRLDQINASLQRTVREYDPTSIERRIKMFQERMNGGNTSFEDPVREAMQERRDFEQGMIKQLHAMLTDEQIEQLPDEPRSRRRGGARGGRGGGGDGFRGGGRRGRGGDRD